MNPDNVIEAFVSTIILVVLLVVAVTIWNQDLGLVLADLIPHFVQLVTWLFVGVIIASLVLQLFED
jgi:uncharacterized membrane protein